MMKIKFLLLALLATLVAAPANATQLLYTLTGAGPLGAKITFQIKDEPDPTASNALGFTLDGVTVNLGPLSGIRTIAFVNTGGLQIRNGGTTVLGLAGGASPRLFTGTTGNPTMKTGDFTLTGSSGTYLLHVAAVPEPATWAMLILGFGAIGVALRTRPARRAALAA
ncbi:PEPxxWA-CTERM sorting domain-containing protein [Sphingomonas sp.]|uniref:PEPxxWA-CTERM sorting domain-containing protein n=1 Tax=Sphingomonas sp. TaxID=28214 RepID=UPI0025F4DEB4|nr:PEPxxWA-CTERM sorting domain-containing protein [Sphingomonas sp.]